MSWVWLLLLVLHGVSAMVNHPPPNTYRYFAFGSNMVQSTLTDLRQVQPFESSAAILPDYQLRFNIPGLAGVEPSAASIEPCPSSHVHGVLYTLSAKDFARVGSTEGVPLAYRWKKCQVCPYLGNGESAGEQTLMTTPSWITAYTLVAPSLGMSTRTSQTNKDIAPSRSYRDILIRGANEWKFDKVYREKLEAIPVADNLLFRDGLAGLSLAWAEMSRKNRNLV